MSGIHVNYDNSDDDTDSGGGSVLYMRAIKDLRRFESMVLVISKVVICENSLKQLKLLLSPGSCPLCWNFASFCSVCKHVPKFHCSVSQFCLQLLGLVEDFQFLSFNMFKNTTWYIGWLSQLLSLICVYFNGIIFNSPDFSFLLAYLKDKIF